MASLEGDVAMISRASALSVIRELQSLRATRPSNEAVEAAKRIVNGRLAPKERPTIDELEKILSAPDAPPISINPDGSIYVADSDAVIVARAILSSSTSREKERPPGHTQPDGPLKSTVL